MKKRVFLSVVLCVALAFQSYPVFADEMRGRGPGGRGGNGGPRGGMGGSQAENDPEIQEVLDSAGAKFSQYTYTDPNTGTELEYSLYIPEEYDETVQYPLIMFIPDASGSGKSAGEIAKQYYGAAVWASDEEQKKHASFVLIPAFSETVVDDSWNTSDQINTAVELISSLLEEYSIDRSRLYTTGQSMGCMTSLYLNSIYPDLFAASLYVSGQWDINVLGNLEDQTFFYITSQGDAKASGGQSEVMSLFDGDGVAYTYGEWNCKDEDQNEKAQALISEGLAANMIRFEENFTDDSGSQQSLTHMLSFNYAYKIEAVRDWLFEQSNEEGGSFTVGSPEAASSVLVGETNSVSTVGTEVSADQGAMHADNQGSLKEGIACLEAEDYEAAMTFFLEGLESGDKKSARYLGMMYEQGLGVEQNTEKAAEYYELGVNAGDLTSCYYLGLLYEQGEGVEQSLEKAAELFAQAVDSGNMSATGVVEAEYELAVLYEQGSGVEQDLEKAIELYTDAAQYENQNACDALERLGIE